MDVTRLKAQQRRKLNRLLGGIRCPGCRGRYLTWASRAGAITCPVCADTYTLTDLRLRWVTTGRWSHWIREDTTP